MNLPIFFLVNFACFASLLILDAYGFEEQAFKFSKYLIAFFSGMVLAEVIA